MERTQARKRAITLALVPSLAGCDGDGSKLILHEVDGPAGSAPQFAAAIRRINGIDDMRAKGSISDAQ